MSDERRPHLSPATLLISSLINHHFYSRFYFFFFFFVVNILILLILNADFLLALSASHTILCSLIPPYSSFLLLRFYFLYPVLCCLYFSFPRMFPFDNCLFEMFSYLYECFLLCTSLYKRNHGNEENGAFRRLMQLSRSVKQIWLTFKLISSLLQISPRNVSNPADEFLLLVDYSKKQNLRCSLRY